MKIIVDENVPYGREAFGLLGEVVTMPGRAMSANDVQDADALVVRSITRVNEALLESSNVRFVGTCTIGEDHIDLPYLEQRGIAFSSAPGCNANSVGEYVTAALLHLADRHCFELSTKSLGIVGVGNVGRQVAAKARTLRLRCVLNDPPLAESTCEPCYRSFEEVLDCDLISLHVPLNKSGLYPTYHLVGEDVLARMRPGVILLNTSRGAVVDNAALRQALSDGRLKAAALDVWEGEPSVDAELLDLVDIATPHIAGYSFDGKVNGTRQVFEALCKFLDVPHSWDPTPLLPPPPCPEILLDAPEGAIPGAVRAVYDIMKDDSGMRSMLRLPESDRAACFDQLRKNYPQRREFQNTRVQSRVSNPAILKQLAALGFQCEGG